MKEFIIRYQGNHVFFENYKFQAKNFNDFLIKFFKEFNITLEESQEDFYGVEVTQLDTMEQWDLEYYFNDDVDPVEWFKKYMN